MLISTIEAIAPETAVGCRYMIQFSGSYSDAAGSWVVRGLDSRTQHFHLHETDSKPIVKNNVSITARWSGVCTSDRREVGITTAKKQAVFHLDLHLDVNKVILFQTRVCCAVNAYRRMQLQLYCCRSRAMPGGGRGRRLKASFYTRGEYGQRRREKREPIKPRDVRSLARIFCPEQHNDQSTIVS
jgi:hypothetical protein